MIFVYSVKIYCILKMSENKKEIQYILKFYCKKKEECDSDYKKICEVYGHDAVHGTKLVQAFSIWKFLCQRCTSFWSTITRKIEIMKKIE